ncbi:hypothetical protein EG328_004426 [Venturia inaequalis]|uniref:Uncharacterized protein n=1 Tax=Venturia inaequalis TaxID=5025 RepID=A0A8H3UNM4_VENIN|nr:hypothetical protein EG328_004426 [Venturia inaequalis]
MDDTTEEVWPEWDDTFAQHDARILFPDLYKGRNAKRNNERYDVDIGDRNNPIIGIPGTEGIQWSEGNKIIEDAFPDYTPPEPYDFENEFAKWNSDTLHKVHLRDECEAAVPEAKKLALEANFASINATKANIGALFHEKSPDWILPSRKDSSGMFNFSNNNKIGFRPTYANILEASYKQPYDEFPPTPGRYPSLSSTGTSQLASSIHSSSEENGPVAKKRKIVSRLDISASFSQNDDNDDGSSPPTPGAPSDMDAEEDGDVTMDDAEPVQASTASLPTTEGQDGLVNINPDVEMSEEFYVNLDATLGAERTEQINIREVGDDPAEHTEIVAEDVIMGESSVAATQHTGFDLAKHLKQTKPRDGEDTQSRHSLPLFPFETAAPVSRTSPIVEIPASSAPLLASPAIEAKASSTKPTQKGQINKSAAIIKTSAPTTPPGKQKQKQVSAASSPIVTASPLKSLQQSVQMGRKSSFSEAQASSEDTSQVKTKGKLSAGILSRTNESLLDDFVFMDIEAVENMKAPELRTHIRGIESLKSYYNGVNKASMIKWFMKWQHQMQALKDEKAEEGTKAVEQSQAGGLGSDEEEEGEDEEEYEEAEEEEEVEEKEEEEEDPDAEGSTDEEFLEAQESPVTGNVTPGQPLKSPFTGQPRPNKNSPLLTKLNAAKYPAPPASIQAARGLGRTKTKNLRHEPDYYKEFEAEKKRENKRDRRSVSRPASYKV